MSCNYQDARPDSLTVAINEVVEKHALKVSDIKNLRSGEQIRVILFDRNIGDYLHGTPAGMEINTKEYLSMNHGAIYTHRGDRPIPKNMHFGSVSDDVKVGWRGPSILYENIDDMPDTFVYYGTCVDDYAQIKTMDLTPLKTTNHLTKINTI